MKLLRDGVTAAGPRPKFGEIVLFHLPKNQRVYNGDGVVCPAIVVHVYPDSSVCNLRLLYDGHDIGYQVSVQHISNQRGNDLSTGIHGGYWSEL